ncbi:WD40-like Beta Propeller Repeat [Flavobacterium micromati]|uniref:WD40-like Beta Propeller Repeat n=1 Tax=Flavobacterium micromati TaxID=229205 RepID=A0A1M5HL48_9FLAO|nr:OmpA family protein [Flavobacterium micromati]SHG16669.1 WD40-like Beta Propeller Repeat [Flavobacterium micromati]
MKNKKLFCLAILFVISFNGYSQKEKVKNADKKYDSYAYIDAIKTYEKIAEKGYKSADLFKKLGNSYFFNAELEKASEWYKELFAMKLADLEPEYYYRYSQSLRSIGRNDLANEILESFNQKSSTDSRGILFMKNVNYLDDIKANSGRFKIEDAGINSIYSDYGTAIYLNQIVFASARDTGSLGQRKHEWTNQYFTNLYTANLDKDEMLGKPRKFDTNINSRFNESTPIFSKDGKTMYFTRNNFLNGKKGKNENKITLLKIYKATLKENKWSSITELPFNSNNYNVAHPALSQDEKTLYFASDMPGTVGQSDLFKVKINENGTYGTPENLGKNINTEGRETFPFISSDNEMYFASDGHPGLGGLDIFTSTINPNLSFGEVQNVGSDINSRQDDFGYLIDAKSRKGFFTSNRDGGKGYDDIYKFLENKRIGCDQELYGEITDIDTKDILPDTKILLFDNLYNNIRSTVSDINGNYTFTVKCGKTYYIRAQKPEYTTKEQKITIAAVNDKTYLPISLENIKCKVTIGDDLGKCFNIKMIYFDLDKSNIRIEAALDLEKILDVLTQNPTMKLDIRSHTDSRQTFKYNEVLSTKRAKSTVNWLMKNGIKADRLTAKGYGETQLVNKCADNVICTEEEHQLNRRSEFIITAL